MRKRFTIHELTHMISGAFEIDKNDVAIDFFKRWLRADPDVFLYERRNRDLENKMRKNSKQRQEYLKLPTKEKVQKRQKKPDVFFIVPVRKGMYPKYSHGDLEFMDFPMTVCHFLNSIKYVVNDGEEWFSKLVRITLEDNNVSRAYEEVAESFMFHQLSRKQIESLDRVTVTLELAMRYCIKAYDGVPKGVMDEYYYEHPNSSKSGKKALSESVKKKCNEYLDLLVAYNIYTPKPRDKNVAAQLIIDLWDLDISVTGVKEYISSRFDQLVKEQSYTDR